MQTKLARCGLSALILVAVGMAGCQSSNNDGNNNGNNGNNNGGGGNDRQYKRTDLVSDGAIDASHTDAQLVNPWGMAFTSSSFFWVANNGTGTSTLYNGNGEIESNVVGGPVLLPAPGGVPGGGGGEPGGGGAGGLVVGGAAPTGMVSNETQNFMLGEAAAPTPASFLFATEDGTILAWSADLLDPTTAVMVIDNSGGGASYKGLAISTAAPARLYATNFTTGLIDVWGTDFAPVFLDVGAFIDPTMPDGFVPFGIQQINDNIYVTYVAPGVGGDEEAGAGLGHVAEFDRDGALIDTIATGGKLNAPWGIARAPSNFGRFGGDLLIGNFGDGRITAVDTSDMTQVGQLTGSNGKPITIDGLWAIMFGNGKNAGVKSNLYFTAGPAGETEGLFGRIEALK